MSTYVQEKAGNGSRKSAKVLKESTKPFWFACNKWMEFSMIFLLRKPLHFAQKGNAEPRGKNGISRSKAVMLTGMDDGIVLLRFLLSKH